MFEPKLQDLDRARAAIAGVARRTPLLPSPWLSERHGAEVFLKCENLQVTGSFKLRGALAALAGLSRAERAAGVVACSAGNHGRGLAFAARRMGIPCRIIVPRSAPRVKTEAIAALGAELLRSPHDGFDATAAWAWQRWERWGGTQISAFEHPDVIAGNGGTTACEILEQEPALDAIVVPCGGGGCAIGVGLAVRCLGERARVIAVNSDASPGMWRSRRDHRPHLSIRSAPTIADGIEGGVGEISFALAERFVDEVVLAKEDSIRGAVGQLVRRERLVVEGAGAAGVAALLDGVLPRSRLAIVLTGGNIDAELLARLLAD